MGKDFGPAATVMAVDIVVESLKNCEWDDIANLRKLIIDVYELLRNRNDSDTETIAKLDSAKKLIVQTISIKNEKL